MGEQLISFETAKLAKEKGFKEGSRKGYLPNGETGISHYNSLCYNDKEDYPTKYAAPTQSLLQKWLREVHKKDVYCWPCESQIDDSNTTWTSGKAVGSYEEALEVGLQEALKSIKLS